MSLYVQFRTALCIVPAVWCSRRGRRNGSGRPGGCRTNNLTSKNFYVHILYQFSRTWVDSSRIYAIRRQILMLKCTKFDYRWGSAPDPLAGFKAPTSKGREAKMEGRGRMESGGEKWGPYYYEREKKEVDRREGRGGKRKGFAGRMSKCFLRPWASRLSVANRISFCAMTIARYTTLTEGQTTRLENDTVMGNAVIPR